MEKYWPYVKILGKGQWSSMHSKKKTNGWMKMNVFHGWKQLVFILVGRYSRKKDSWYEIYQTKTVFKVKCPKKCRDVWNKVSMFGKTCTHQKQYQQVEWSNSHIVLISYRLSPHKKKMDISMYNLFILHF